MKLVIILFAIYAFLESSSYAVYEYKKIKSGAVSIIILASFGLVLPIFSILL